jgi:hypothetical protein
MRVVRTAREQNVAAKRELLVTAYHEAGHAVIAYRLNRAIREDGVQAFTDAPGYGSAHVRSEAFLPIATVIRDFGGIAWEAWKHRAEEDIIVSLAGPYAELRFLKGKSPSGVITGVSQDLTNVTDRLNVLFGSETDPNRGFYLWLYCDEVRRMLREKRTWAAIQALAARLMKNHRVSPLEVDRLCARVPRRRRFTPQKPGPPSVDPR